MIKYGLHGEKHLRLQIGKSAHLGVGGYFEYLLNNQNNQLVFAF